MKPSLGKPAGQSDLIVQRRMDIVSRFEGFFHRGARVLDLGCGNGATMLLMSDRVAEVDGVDISEENREAFEAQKTRGAVTNCRFLVLGVEEIDESERYDRIVSFEVLEHLPDDREAAGKMYRLLKPGGEAVVSVPNKWWIFETHGARLPLLPWHRVPFFSWLPNWLHRRFAKARIYTRRRIGRLLKEAGFEILDVAYVTAPMDAVGSPALQRFLRRFFFRTATTRVPFLATSVLVHVRKSETGEAGNVIGPNG